MKRALLAATLLALVVPALAVAQANDVGTNPAATGTPLLGGVAPDAGLACPPAGAVSAAFTGATTQLGRIFRDGIASTCPSKVYPGIFNPSTTYNYETFTYSNTSGATACVTVNFDPNTGPGTVCATNAHASAYLGSYDPANQATNFVGDVGSSVTQPFSFDVPALTDLVLAVTNTSSAAICGFSFQVVNLPCVEEADLALTKTVAPATAAPGTNVVYTLTVTNNGPAGATNVVVTDLLPAGLTYVSDTCGGANLPPWTWNAGTLANGASTSCDVTATVAGTGMLTNAAAVTADNADPVSANNAAAANLTVLQSALEIPTLGLLGLAALALLLAATAFALITRRRATR